MCRLWWFGQRLAITAAIGVYLSALVGACIDSLQHAGRRQARSGLASRFDLGHLPLAIFRADHSSAAPWEIAESFLLRGPARPLPPPALSPCASPHLAAPRCAPCRRAFPGRAHASPGSASACASPHFASPPTRSDTTRAPGTRRCTAPRPSPRSRSPPAAPPLLSRPARQRAWTAGLSSPTLDGSHRKLSVTRLPSSATLPGGNSLPGSRGFIACPYLAIRRFSASPRRFRSYPSDSDG